MTIFVEDKLKPGVVGDKLADAVDIETTTELQFATANEKLQAGGVTLTDTTPTGLADSVKVSTENLSNIDTGGTSPFATTISALLSGSSVTTDHQDDQVVFNSGFSYAVDYRDNAQGDVNDDTHYNTNGVTITGNNAANTFSTSGWSDHRMLIALELDIDSTRVGTGAMVTKFGLDATTELDFIRIDDNRLIQVRTDPTDLNSDTPVTTGLGNFVLSNTSSYWIVFEIMPRAGDGTDHELITGIMEIPDATPANLVFTECNNININLSSTVSTVLGLSRSTSQVGRIDEFKIIRTENYLSHNTLENLLRNHLEDKWVFGYATLLEGADEHRVTLASDVELRGDIAPTRVGGVDIGFDQRGGVLRVNASGTGIEIVDFSEDITSTAIAVNVLTLPENYTDYELLVYTVIEDLGQYTSHNIPTRMLEANPTISNHRISGNDTAVWSRTARTLTADSTSDVWNTAVLMTPRVK